MLCGTISRDAQMFSYLFPRDGAVIDGNEAYEVVYAKNQPQYLPLRALVSTGQEKQVLSRWTLTDEKRKAIANGADIYLTLWTFGAPLHPISMAIGDGTEVAPFGVEKRRTL